jgi:hypothetical protein
MRSTILLGLFLATTWTACCNRADCAHNEALIYLRFLRNGVSAIYGPNAFVHPDSLTLTICQNECYPNTIAYVEESDIVPISVRPGYLNLLTIPGIRTDTFTCKTRIASVGECCTGYEVLEVRRNGIIICTSMCNEIIDIEI